MFPMRSRFRSCLIGLVCCAGIVSALSAYAGKAASSSDTAYLRRMDPPVARVAAQPAHVSDALHFDLDCDVRGRVITDAHPEMFRGTYPANEPWHDHPHYIVDLQALRICTVGECMSYEPHRILRVTPDRIVLHDEPGFAAYIRRQNLRYEQRTEDLGEVAVTRGTCVIAPFSGFPTRQAG